MRCEEPFSEPQQALRCRRAHASPVITDHSICKPNLHVWQVSGSCRPGDSGSAAMTCAATDESTCKHEHLVPLHACICRPSKSCDLQANKWLRTLLADFSALHRDVKRAAILEMMADSNARQQDLKWDILGCCIREGNKVGSYLPDDALHISRVLHEDQDRWSHFSQQFASAGLSRSPVNFSRA